MLAVTQGLAAAGVGKETADGEGAAGRRGEDDGELTGLDSAEEVVIEGVIVQIVSWVAEDRIVVDALGGHAQVGEVSFDAVGSRVGAGE